MSPIDQLPDDSKVLKEHIAELYKLFDEQMGKRDAKIEQLTQQVQLLLRARYGKKAETFTAGQLTLFESAQAPAATEATEEATTETASAGKKHGRGKPSKTLPRKRIVYEIPQAELACPDCGDTRKQFGEETSEQYDYVPSSICVIEHVRCKYACSKCQGHVVIADAGRKPIEKGLAASGMLAYVATSKLADHQPLHRLEGIFKRQGADISRSTMSDWVAASASIILPLYEYMKERVLKSRIVWTDDTPVKLQDRDDERNMREARIWVYIGDKENKFTVYDFTDSRKRDGPKNFLSNFKGYLQADAFTGYDCIYAAGNVREVACMAHARRKFFDSQSSDQVAATEALSMIRTLYAIEKEAAELTPEERRKLRLKKAAPKLALFKRWLNRQRLTSLPKSPLGKAVTYALNNWKALCRYLCDGELSIDNNPSERALRAVAIGRKNWLFAGSREGGKNAAILSSLIATCKQYNVNPQQYLTDILNRLASGERDFEKLLPGTWVSATL